VATGVLLLPAGLFALPASALAHEDTVTHASLTEGALHLLDSEFYSGLHDVVTMASVDEDACPNYLSHFYNPKTFTFDDYCGIDNCLLAPDPPYTYFPGDGTGSFMCQRAVDRAQGWWDHAVAAYHGGDKKKAVEYLGHAMHLLQDMTSPAHVHLDVHATPGPFSACNQDADDFERWGYCPDFGSSHIRDYVSRCGEFTPRMQNSLDLLYEGLPRVLVGPGGEPSSATTYVHGVAELTYDFTSFHVVLEDPNLDPDNEQPDSELKRMFPTLHEDGGSFYSIDGAPDQTIGSACGNCGGAGCALVEWWVEAYGCTHVSFPYPRLTGYAYIENTGGEPGDGNTPLDLLVPRRYEKPMFLQLYGDYENTSRTRTMLRIYGDVLYTTAVAYGAGLLQSFEDTVEPAPVADAGGPYQEEACLPIAFDAGGSSVEHGTIELYEWDFDDDGVFDAAGPSPQVAHVYGHEYSGEALLRVTASNGRTGTDPATVVVGPCFAPVADAGGPYHGKPGQVLFLDGRGSSDLDGTIVRYEWDYDADGVIDRTSSYPVASLTHQTPFVGHVALTVTDDAGRTGTDVAEIRILP
jgi:hypothetical protein